MKQHDLNVESCRHQARYLNKGGRRESSWTKKDPLNGHVIYGFAKRVTIVVCYAFRTALSLFHRHIFTDINTYTLPLATLHR